MDRLFRMIESILHAFTVLFMITALAGFWLSCLTLLVGAVIYPFSGWFPTAFLEGTILTTLISFAGIFGCMLAGVLCELAGCPVDAHVNLD